MGEAGKLWGKQLETRKVSWLKPHLNVIKPSNSQLILHKSIFTRFMIIIAIIFMIIIIITAENKYECYCERYIFRAYTPGECKIWFQVLTVSLACF